MDFKHKIKAFTLTEILVVLVISAIVVGMALSVLNLVQQNFLSIRKNFQNTTGQQLFQQRLIIDFNRYHSIYLNNDRNEIWMKNPLDSVLYLYQGHSFLRQQDTIDLKISKITWYYRGEEVGKGKVDAAKLYIGEKGSAFIFVSKHNDAKNSFE